MPVYRSNGCPDRSADGMIAYCRKAGAEVGPIENMPETPGLFLYKPGHAGIYIGNGRAIEARGFDEDIARTKVAGRGWTNWAKLPFVRYGEREERIKETGLVIDVSEYQGFIRWSTVKPQIDCAILRVSCGMKADARFERNRRACEKLGIPYGVYHYLKGRTISEARAEALMMDERCAGGKARFFVADVEDYGASGDDVRALVSAFIEALTKRGPKKTGLYIAHHHYKHYKLDTEAVDFVWIPRYGGNSGRFELAPAYPCDLHQFTSRGRVPGISGNVDLNRVTGTGKDMPWFRGEPIKTPARARVGAKTRACLIRGFRK